MAEPSIRDHFFRLPPTTLILVLSAVFGLADGHALPRQTTTIEYHELHIIAWPPVPTEAPLSPFELLRRQEDNTVCGYIGDLPATCSAGSHCVLDTQHNVMGCCPNGGPCSTGVFTGCVDYNSGAQTEVNPYIYTCEGSDVCYKNQFGGGIYQYGCGTASNLATSVQTSLSGVGALIVPTTSVVMTETPTALSEPTTINPSTGTRSFSSISKSSSSAKSSSSSSISLTSSESSSSKTSSSSSTSSSTSSRTSSTSTKTTPSSSVTGTASSTSSTTPAAPAATSNFDQTGAIVGGTISGVAILIALVAIAIFYLQKRRNRRQGPGPAPPAAPSTEYMSPVRSHGTAFAPLPTWQEEDEPPTPQPQYNQPYTQPGQPINMYNPYEPAHGTPMHAMGGQATAEPSYYNSVAVSGDGATATPIADAHMRTGSNELDEFSHGYTTAVGQIQHDEDRQPLTVTNPEENNSGSESGSPSRQGGRPLWQQNRRQSRNLMWM